MAWTTSTRSQRLPPNWPAIRQRVKTRAQGRCEAAIHEPDCDGTGTDCDHITPGDNHNLSNLQWLSRPCHKAKTARENAAARATMQAALKHPTERHPGTLGGDSKPPMKHRR